MIKHREMLCILLIDCPSEPKDVAGNLQEDVSLFAELIESLILLVIKELHAIDPYQALIPVRYLCLQKRSFIGCFGSSF